MGLFLFLFYLGFSFTVLYREMKPALWQGVSAVYLLIATFVIGMPVVLGLCLWGVVVAVVLIQRVEPIRLALSDMLFTHAKRFIPRLSKTEEEALNAGDPWLEQDLFRGQPDWTKLLAVKTELTSEEQAFLDHEVVTLCSMLDEWSITQERDLPASVWTYMKEKGFFGLVISKEYGGKGFSARAHSDIVVKIASRSGVAAVTVMVPNSLGPGELLHHYGTTEQKRHYLPRLATGQEIPCFALTEPDAGSDATSLKSTAIVVEKEIEGQKVLGLSLTLNKRWITLSPVATLIGLAVHLYDPDGLLNGKGTEGITCLLIPRDTEHLEIGQRHLPADQPFMNGTIRGENLFVPMTSIIGGQEKAGQGWQMLVECLSIGRSISLPALGAASSSVSYLMSGAFARLRRQFNVEIGQFEGIEEKLAEIAGLNYIINATRHLTLAAVNEGKKPSVASAITKYFNTELARVVVNAAMDVHAGRAVVVGPRNYLANYYQGIPISVTVEGANIMSRNLLIFGQGAIVCHPYIRAEIAAIQQEDKKAFHHVLWSHIHYFMQNLAKTICTVWTGGRWIESPSAHLKRAYQGVARLSYAYAWLADFALICLGGALKRKERLSARLADGLSYLYLAMAVLRQAEEADHADDRLHAAWAVQYCLYHAQKSLLAFCHNFPNRWLGWIMRLVAFPFGQTMVYPSDQLDHEVAQQMVENNAYRERLKSWIYLSGDSEQPLDRMEYALQLLIKESDVYQKLHGVKRSSFSVLVTQLAEKVKQGELTEAEQQAVLAVETARWNAMQVDEFTAESMQKKTFKSVTQSNQTPFG